MNRVIRSISDMPIPLRVKMKDIILHHHNLKPFGHKCCLLWQRTNQNRNNYGQLKRFGYQIDCHRAIYYGSNPHEDPSTDMEISHLCREKRCVNIKHLVAERKSENDKRRSCVQSCKGHHIDPPCIFKETQ